jgi:hypothetical protein
MTIQESTSTSQRKRIKMISSRWVSRKRDRPLTLKFSKIRRRQGELIISNTIRAM